MTKHELLDHFAGIALAELIKGDIEKVYHGMPNDEKKATIESTARGAYAYAMMMLRNREAAHDWLNKITKPV